MGRFVENNGSFQPAESIPSNPKGCYELDARAGSGGKSQAPGWVLPRARWWNLNWMMMETIRWHPLA
ncbi:hypothetical protein [Glutamicibacter sp.]|uniref:hypothetical protein n=1 Tax=Glutamicibacter sp. TaxID=1931995 RepID=UPI003D6BFE06